MSRRQRGFTIIELLIAFILLGVASLAVISLVNNSGESAGQLASVASQNNKMRTAMATIQRELSEATSPIVALDTGTCTVPGGSCVAPSGNSVAFIRKENDDSGSRVYFVERIRYNDETAPAQYRNTITIQTVRTNSAVLSVSDATTRLNAASAPAPRVLLDKVVKPTTADPLFQYYQNATTPAVYSAGSSWYSTVKLVEVNLRRDEDLALRAGGSGAVADATANQKYATTRLASSIYLKRLGDQVEGNNDDISC